MSAPASPPPGTGERAVPLRLVLPGLMVAMLLAMLDNMIVTPALPRILGDLGGVDHLSWVVTAYILGTTVSTPVWGKLGDLYGRKRVFLTAIVIFLVGSALCGVAGADVLGGTDRGMLELIAFRAVQGLGAGGLMVGVMAILGDLVSPRERGRYQGQFAAIMALAMVGGPLAGGLITDHLSWRWAFYVNIPLGGAVLLWLGATLHLPRRRTPHRIDWLGAAALSVAVTALVLVTTWGGTEYPWLSAPILGLVAVALVLTAVFVAVEQRVAEPILPLRVLANRNFALITAIGFLLGFAMFGALSFLPLYQQTVQGASATNSGLLLLPIMAGALVTSLVVGKSITRTGRYRIFPIVGGVLMVVAALLLAQLDVGTSKLTAGVHMAVLGVGMGFLMQTTMLIAQNSAEQRDLGVASSTATFFRSIGGSFGVALFGAVFAHRVSDGLGGGPPAGEGAAPAIDPATLDALPAAVRAQVLETVAEATSTVFWWSVPFAVAVPVLAWFVREVPLRGSEALGGGEAVAESTGAPALAAEASAAGTDAGAATRAGRGGAA